ncbi:LppM family (lipo)protein [Actinomyces slackii]|uniref:LppM domain-containing protein n=1 Tax=Actinomyces slackii TaxID=52774 RepID=A0A3S4SIQ9_9ACTO|nr:hypothetical protein [Actinomyces slackii]VEG73546.1 Uncharacterised protein [Actinomyces slackii]
MSTTLTAPVAPVRRGLLAAGLVGLLSVLALLPAVGHAQPLPISADSSDASSEFEVEINLIIRSNDTVIAKYVLTDRADYDLLTEDDCRTKSLILTRSKDSRTKTSFSFEDKGDSRVCTIEGVAKIEDVEVTHEGDEYVATFEDDHPGSDQRASISVSFPGEVTQADGGTVDGTTVTLDSLGHTVRGKESSGFPWLSLGLGLVVLLAVGGGVAGVLVSQNKKKKAAAAAQAGGYIPQPFPGQYPQAPGQYPQAQFPGQYPQAPGHS